MLFDESEHSVSEIELYPKFLLNLLMRRSINAQLIKGKQLQNLRLRSYGLAGSQEKKSPG